MLLNLNSDRDLPGMEQILQSLDNILDGNEGSAGRRSLLETSCH